MIKRKMISWMLAVAMILSMFVGIGVNDRVAEAETDIQTLDVVWSFKVNDKGEADNLYVKSLKNGQDEIITPSKIIIPVETDITGLVLDDYLRFFKK